MDKLKFVIRFDQRGAGFYEAFDFYKAVQDILISKNIATHVVQYADPKNPETDGEIVHVEIPYEAENTSLPSQLTIENVRNSLSGIIDKYEKYSNLQIDKL